MAGYNYEAGMSNNAVRAYHNGVKPLSKITRKNLDDAGLNITKKFATWLAKNNYWRPSEWHHSGGNWFNEVYFYDPEELAELINYKEIDIDNLKIKFEQSNKIIDEGQAVTGTYVVWGGTRNHPRKLKDEPFTGIKKGNWIYIDGEGKKKADGNHIEWRYKEVSKTLT